jgi:copper chaperone CopZ
MSKVVLKIEGMSCQGCVTRVKKTLETLEGVAVEKVDVGSATLTVDEAHSSPAKVIAALDDAGYDATATSA